MAAHWVCFAKTPCFSSASKFVKQDTGKILSVHEVREMETKYQKNEANDLKENIDSSLFSLIFLRFNSTKKIFKVFNLN